MPADRGRPRLRPGEATERITVRLPASTHDLLARAAARPGWDESRVVRHLIEMHAGSLLGEDELVVIDEVGTITPEHIEKLERLVGECLHRNVIRLGYMTKCADCGVKVR